MTEFVSSFLYWGLWAMLVLVVAFLVTAGYFVFQRVANSKSRPRRKSSRPRAKKVKKTSKRQEEDEEVPVWLLYIIGGIFALALAAAVIFGIYSAVKAVLQFLAAHMWIVWAFIGLVVLVILVIIGQDIEEPECSDCGRPESFWWRCECQIDWLDGISDSDYEKLQRFGDID